jgi:hypothetical protein
LEQRIARMRSSVPGSLDKKGGTRFHLLLSKRWNLDGIFFPLFFVQRTRHSISGSSLLWLEFPAAFLPPKEKTPSLTNEPKKSRTTKMELRCKLLLSFCLTNPALVSNCVLLTLLRSLWFIKCLFCFCLTPVWAWKFTHSIS